MVFKGEEVVVLRLGGQSGVRAWIGFDLKSGFVVNITLAGEFQLEMAPFLE